MPRTEVAGRVERMVRKLQERVEGSLLWHKLRRDVPAQPCSRGIAAAIQADAAIRMSHVASRFRQPDGA